MPDFKPMLAKDANLDKLTFPLVIQPKIDGIRCSIVGGKALSRTLKEIPNREIFEALSFPEYEGFDGEIVVGPVTDPNAMQATSSFVMAPNKTGAPWVFHVFDKWNEKGGVQQRRVGVLDVLGDRWPDRGKIRMLETVLIEDAADLERTEAMLIEHGYEGAILRNPAAEYKFGRSGVTKGECLKLKRFIDFEAEIVGVYEEMHNGNEAVTNALGRTERSSVSANKTGKGTLGGFYVKAINGPAEGVEFKVGTGFDAAQRQKFWALADDLLTEHDIIGKTIKVKSFPIGVKDKPRHPVFLGFRDMDIDG